MAIKPNTLPLPPMSHTDAKGAVWNFNPATGDWNVVVGGKKMSSKDSHVLRERVGDLAKTAAQEKAKAGQTSKPMEVALGAIGLDKRGRASSFSFSPIVAKIEWDAGRNKPAILRYKPGPDEAWKKFQADTLLLIHPNYLSPEMKQTIELALRIEHINSCFTKAEQAIAKAWWNSKENHAQLWSINHKGEFSKMLAGVARSGFSRREGMATSTELPLLSSQGDDLTVGWEGQEDGTIRKKSVVIKMDIDFSPQFSLLSDQQPGVVIFQSSDLTHTLAMAKATLAMEKTAPSALCEWQQIGDIVEHGRTSWPTGRIGYAQTLLNQENEQNRSTYATSYFYGRYDVGMSVLNSDRAELKKEAGCDMWRDLTGYNTYSFRAQGAEDACLQQVLALRNARDALLAKQPLSEIKHQDIEDIFKPTISEVYNAVGDGEELGKDFVAMGEQLNRISLRAQQQVERDEDMQAWTSHCNKACEHALAVIANPPKATAKKSAKPR